MLLFLHEDSSIKIKVENLFTCCLLLLTKEKLPRLPTHALYSSLQHLPFLGI